MHGKPHFREVAFAVALLVIAPLQIRAIRQADTARRLDEALPRGTRVPPLAASTKCGVEHRLDDYTGHPVVVVFWTSWCLPCRVEMYEIADYLSSCADDATKTGCVAVLAVNVEEEPAEVTGVLDNERFRKITFLFDTDGVIRSDWKVASYPTIYVIDAHGRILEAHIGYEKGFREEIGKWIRHATKESSR